MRMMSARRHGFGEIVFTNTKRQKMWTEEPGGKVIGFWHHDKLHGKNTLAIKWQYFTHTLFGSRAGRNSAASATSNSE